LPGLRNIRSSASLPVFLDGGYADPTTSEVGAKSEAPPFTGLGHLRTREVAALLEKTIRRMVKFLRQRKLLEHAQADPEAQSAQAPTRPQRAYSIGSASRSTELERPGPLHYTMRGSRPCRREQHRKKANVCPMSENSAPDSCGRRIASERHDPKKVSAALLLSTQPTANQRAVVIENVS
jgi:hypothetical protein